MFELLKMLDPEIANKIALTALRLGLGPKAQPASERFELFGKTLPSRVGLAGGADKNGTALHGWQRMGFGFVEIGTVTVKPREGNARPRIWRLPDGESLINYMGLPNRGVHAVVAQLEAFRATAAGKSFCVGASVASPDGKLDELEELVDNLSPLVDFFTFNASCPNVSGHGGEQQLEDLCSQVQVLTCGPSTVPVLVKLAPTRNEENLKRAASAFLEVHAQGFVVCNTVPYVNRDLIDKVHQPDNWPQRDGAPVGGYSGRGLWQTSSFMVPTLRQHVGKHAPIIAVGGIDSPHRARQIIQLGATAVQVYTGLTLKGPSLLQNINDELRRNAA